MREKKQTKMLGNVIKHVNMNGSARKYQFKLRSQTHNKYSEDNLTGSVVYDWIYCAKYGVRTVYLSISACNSSLADATLH